MPRGDLIIWKLQRRRRPSNSPHCAAAVVPRSAPRKAPFRLSGSLVPSTVHSFRLSLAASPKLKVRVGWASTAAAFKIPEGVKMHLFYAIEYRIPSCLFREFWIASTLLVCCSICEYSIRMVASWQTAQEVQSLMRPCFMLDLICCLMEGSECIVACLVASWREISSN